MMMRDSQVTSPLSADCVTVCTFDTVLTDVTVAKAETVAIDCTTETDTVGTTLVTVIVEITVDGACEMYEVTVVFGPGMVVVGPVTVT